MGNYMSCTFIITSTIIKTSKTTKVIFPDGERKLFRDLVKAAELMLECPNFFLVNSKSLNIGKRFSALSANEDLEFGNVYIMFPMKRVNSMVTPADMAVFFMPANSAAKRIAGGKVRVLPEVAAQSRDGSSESEVGRLRLSLDDREVSPATEFNSRSAIFRSKKPMLETIKE